MALNYSSEKSHKDLLPFFNKHKSEHVLLMAPGPTLTDFDIDKWKTNHPNTKICCVNGVILHKPLKELCDYVVWAGDIDVPHHRQPGFYKIFEEAKTIDLTKTKVFVNGTFNGGKRNAFYSAPTQLHPNIIKKHNWINYEATTYSHHRLNWFIDIYTKGVDNVSVAFQALQILLFMGFTNITLVGFDIFGDHSYKNHVKNDVCDWNNNEAHKTLLNRWQRFKEYLEKSWKHIHIDCINPIGLKGVFSTLEGYNKVGVNL